MSNTNFEGDPDFVRVQELTIGNDPDGGFVANVVEADKFDPSVTDSVEGLLLLGYLTQKVGFFGHEFVLKTLTRGERLAVALAAEEYAGNMGFAQAMETATLALALAMVDGRPLSIPLGPDEGPQEKLARNLKVLERWYDPVLEALYVEYQTLRQRMVDAFVALQGKSTAGRTTPSP